MKSIIKSITIFFIVTLFTMPKWSLNYFGLVNFDQVVFTIMNAEGGANHVPIIDYFKQNYLRYIFAYLFYEIIKRFIKRFEFKSSRQSFQLIFFNKSLNFSFLWLKPFFICFMSCAILVAGIYSAYDVLKIDAFIKQHTNKTTVYEDHYIHPNDVEITFPQEKRNFIHIVLESMEDNFSNYPINGANVNLIPNLSNISKENFTFNLNGKSTYQGLSRFGFTVASLVALTSGNALNIPIGGNSYGKDGVFLPGAKTFGEILEENGYSNYFYIGSDKAFAGRDTYYSSHGNYDIFDYTRAIEEGYIPEDYKVFWGFEDSKLVEYAKNKLSEISKQDEPFNFKLLTVDSHFQDGYTDPTCPQLYDVAYANALNCSDTIVSNFINWIQQQDFYENTTILVTGDHLTMNSEFGSVQEDRSLYHTIINGENLGESKARMFSAVDWFPTSLHLLGADIEGDRLGFGTNLFSDKPTYLEQFGFEFFNELGKKSDYYTNNILKKAPN